MYQTDQATAASSLPTPSAQGTPGFFTNGNPTTGTPATILDADFMNMLMMELINVLAAGGVTPSKTAYNQVLIAIKALVQSAQSTYGVDTGSANTYQVAFVPAVTAIQDGLRLRFKAKTANTGASTFSPNGLSASPIWNMQHVALTGSEIVATGDVEIVWNNSLNGGGGAWVLLENTGGAAQLGNGSYGISPAQLDNSSKLATTTWAMQFVNGRYGVVNITGAFGLGANHINSRVALSGSGSYVVTLPPANQCPAGAGIFLFNNTQAGSATIQASGTDGLNLGGVGQPSGVQISTDQFVWVVTDGATGWYCVMQNIFGFAPNQFDSSARLPTTTWVNQRGLQTSGITTLTSTTTLSAAAAGGTVVGNSAGSITATLPSAASFAAGARIQFLNINTGPMAVTRAGADSISVNNSSVTSLSLSNGDTLTVESNGSNGWYAVSGSVQLQYASILRLTRSLGSSGTVRIPAYPGDSTPAIIQWGQFTSSSSAGSPIPVSFPATFPSSIYQLVLTSAGSTTSTFSAWYDSQTVSGFNGHSNNPSAAVSYIAIGA